MPETLTANNALSQDNRKPSCSVCWQDFSHRNELEGFRLSCDGAFLAVGVLSISHLLSGISYSPKIDFCSGRMV